MTNEEPKITFESILQNWNANYNPTTKGQARQYPKMLKLNATMRNPETPAGTYPAFEAYLGVDVLEKKRQLKQEKQRKRKEIRKKHLWFPESCHPYTSCSRRNHWRFHVVQAQRPTGSRSHPNNVTNGYAQCHRHTFGST